MGDVKRATSEPSEHPSEVSGDELRRLLHELQVHQVELEMQNLELREAQRVLEATRSRYVDLYDFAPVAYITLDAQACIREINLTGARFLKVDRARIVGLPFSPFVRKDDIRRFFRHVRDCLQSGAEQTVDIGLCTARGELVDVQLHSTWFLETVAGELEPRRLCRTAIVDVTELRQMQARLALSERMASLGVLAAGVAHEINNPLTFLFAGLEAVRAAASEWPMDSQGQERAREIAAALAEVEAGAARIRDVVRHLQLFSRPTQEAAVPVDVRRALDLAVSMARNAIHHRARLRLEIGELPPVLGDESRLGQVVLNLLLNAAHAIPEGAVQGHEVSLRAAASGDRVVVEVSDTGAGIPPEVLARIFDPFFTTKPVGEGLGLGLAISHRIVASLGGELNVESEVGRGSTFRVVLPRAAAGSPTPAPPEPAPAPSRRLRLLVIDDEPFVGISLHRILRREHDVDTEVRAEDALARLRAGERYDVILCDLMMPEMSGERFLGELTGIEPDPRSAVIFMSGGAFSPESRAFLERVPNAYIDKPFSLDQLRRLLASAAARDPVMVVVDRADGG